MKKYQTSITLLTFIILVGLTLNSSYNPFTQGNNEELSFVDVTKHKDKLYLEIEEKSASYEKPPQDAYIDKVWKKTPGRNGLKINVDKSYKQMKSDGKFKKSLLVYDEVSPEKSLNDLSASPIYRGHPEKKMTAFLINVSWGTEYILDILSILKESNIKATFFIEGKWAKENAEYVKMMDEQGHTIGNHAYNHPDMARMSNQAILDQIVQTNDVIEAIIDKEPQWFAPPSGSFNQDVVLTADNLGMETVLWTVDTIDWKNPSSSVLIKRVVDKMHPGATVLMHPTESVVSSLPKLIEKLEKKEYDIGSIDNLLSEER